MGSDLSSKPGNFQLKRKNKKPPIPSNCKQDRNPLLAEPEPDTKGRDDTLLSPPTQIYSIPTGFLGLLVHFFTRIDIRAYIAVMPTAFLNNNRHWFKRPLGPEKRRKCRSLGGRAPFREIKGSGEEENNNSKPFSFFFQII